MKDAQKPDHVSLTTLIGRLREGRFVIPDFQREFEWKPWDIRDLVRSIFLDYYIGSLLLWKGKSENFEALACESIYGYNGSTDPVHIVLDGQQRLTAMYYVFLAPDVSLPNRSNRFLFFIRVDRFMEEAYDEAFEYDWTRRGLNLLEDQSAQYENHMFPVSVVGQGGWELPNWVQGYEKYWQDKEAAAAAAGDDEAAQDAMHRVGDAKGFGEHLKGITEQYQIAYIELDRDLEIDKVCDIFTQINSRGIRLDVFDLINALLKPKGLQLKHLWREAAQRLDFVETERMNVYLLQVMSILRQAYCSPKYLYYLDAQRKLRHWYWASVFNNRYSGSVESTSARDYLDVKAWFENDAAEPGLIAEFKARFKNLELRRETKRGTSVYNGIFNLLVLRGARDWMTGNVPQYGDLDDHHIVPSSWGKEQGLGGAIHTILNRTPLTADTNRNVIRDRLPNEYLPELVAANGEDSVRDTLESHFISPTSFEILLRDPFTPEDFEDFLAERQRTLQDAIEDLLVKERLDLPPNLRELDANIEEVELALRRDITEALGGDSSQLPSHVQQKIAERLHVAAKKNAALDAEHYETLGGKLEYADLRELQDTIMSKALWSLFEGRYANKETLSKRFGQLADLRNGIRHSRNVDEVTRKEGEAAVLWFQQVLG